MATAGDRDVRFRFTQETPPNETLLAGFAEYGLAGLTAANFVVDQLDLEEVGHVAVEGFPTITPFEGGTPRRPIRLFGGPDADLTVLTSDQFLPNSVAEPFAADLSGWVADGPVSELAVTSGIPLAHGPEGHRTFYIATEEYREERLADTDVTPMGNGFLDGVKGALVERALADSTGAGVFVTPVHQQVPDVEASLRLVETLRAVYDLDLDTAPLEAFAEEIRRYYENLATRFEDGTGSEQPEDRMYM